MRNVPVAGAYWVSRTTIHNMSATVAPTRAESGDSHEPERADGQAYESQHNVASINGRQDLPERQKRQQPSERPSGRSSE